MIVEGFTNINDTCMIIFEGFTDENNTIMNRFVIQ